MLPGAAAEEHALAAPAVEAPNRAVPVAVTARVPGAAGTAALVHRAVGAQGRRPEAAAAEALARPDVLTATLEVTTDAAGEPAATVAANRAGRITTADSIRVETARMAASDMAARRAVAAEMTVAAIRIMAGRATTMASAAAMAAAAAMAWAKAHEEPATGLPAEREPGGAGTRAAARRTALAPPMGAGAPVQAGARAPRPGVRTGGVLHGRVPRRTGLVGPGRRAAATGKAGIVPSADGRARTGRSAGPGRPQVARSGAAASPVPASPLPASPLPASPMPVSSVPVSAASAGTIAVVRRALVTGTRRAAGRAATDRSEVATRTGAVAAGSETTGISVADGQRVTKHVAVPGRAATDRSAAVPRSGADGRAPTGRGGMTVRALRGPATTGRRGIPHRRATTGHRGTPRSGALTSPGAMTGQDRRGPGTTGRHHDPTIVADRLLDGQQGATVTAAHRGPTRGAATSTSAWTCPTASPRTSWIQKHWPSSGRCQVILPVWSPGCW